MNVIYNKEINQIFVNNYKLLLNNNYYLSNNIIDAIDLYTNQKVKLKLIPIEDINAGDLHQDSVEQKIVMISKVKQIQGQHLTKCLQIIVPQTLYAQNQHYVAPPHLIDQVTIKTFQMKEKKEIDTQKHKTQYNVKQALEYLQNSYIIAFELANCTLEDEIKNKTDFQQIRQYLYDILQGIYELHQNNIIHNDIKASNCLIFKNHQKGAKITDFDLSSDLNENLFDKQNILLTNPMYNIEEIIDSCNTTVQFASPESQSALKVQSGFLNDIWQFGQLILYCFTGLQLNVSLSRNSADYVFFKDIYGPELADLISLCTEAQSLRPSAKTLLNHPFFTCKNIDDYKFDLKETLSERLLHKSARKILRCSSLPSKNVLSPHNLIRYQQQQKVLLNKINISLRNELPSEFGTNSDRITELTIQKDNQFKIKRSQSTPYKEYHTKQVKTINFLLSQICNEDNQNINNHYINYFVIDKLDLFYVDQKADMEKIQQMLLTINLYILSNTISLHSTYFDDKNVIRQQECEYDQYHEKIIKFRDERQYEQSSLQPLSNKHQKLSYRSEYSLSSSRIKATSNQDNSSIISGKLLQKSFKNARKSMITSQITESNMSGSSALFSNDLLDNINTEHSSIPKTNNTGKQQKMIQPLYFDDSFDEQSYSSKQVLPPIPILQPKNDSFECFQLNAQQKQQDLLFQQNDNSQTSTKTNFSFNLSQTLVGDSIKPMISVSKTSQSAYDAPSLPDNIFQIPQDITVEESYSSQALQTGRMLPTPTKDSNQSKTKSDFLLESSDFI